MADDLDQMALTKDADLVYELSRKTIHILREQTYGELASILVSLQRILRLPHTANVQWWVSRMIPTFERAVAAVEQEDYGWARDWARCFTVGYLREYRQIRDTGRLTPPPWVPPSKNHARRVSHG